MHKIIEGPAAWRGADLAASRDWIHEFTPAEIREIEDALRSAKARGKTLDTLTKEDFPLPAVARRIAFARDFLEDGKGIYQFRGIKIDGYSKDDLRLLYWGLGRHLGTAVSQSKDGDILGDVRNVGVDIHSPQGRGYKSNQRLNFHTDSADVVGLFVLCAAMRGGLSKVASSVSAHNEILRRRPDLLELLYRPYPRSRLGEEKGGETMVYMLPVFGLRDGRFTSHYSRTYIEAAQQLPDAPRLTAAQWEAIDLLAAVADALCYRMRLEPGDMQFLNNHVIYHARDAFSDDAASGQVRQMYRLWLAMPNSRALPEDHAVLWGDVRAGALRGGIAVAAG